MTGLQILPVAGTAPQRASRVKRPGLAGWTAFTRSNAIAAALLHDREHQPIRRTDAAPGHQALDWPSSYEQANAAI